MRNDLSKSLRNALEDFLQGSLEENEEFQLNIPVSSYCGSLLVVTLGFIVIHCFFNYYTHSIEEVPWLIHQLFDLDEENNLPTWFSGFLLLNNAFLLFLIARTRRGDHFIHWNVLALGFLGRRAQSLHV